MLVVGSVAAVVVAAVVVLRSGGGPRYPDEWDPRVAGLAAFVEDERGLAFAHPVHVDFLTGGEYSDMVRVDQGTVTDEARDEMESTVATLRALGLASGDVDLFEAGNDLVDSGTLAFYNPGTERIIVRGTEVTVDLEVTLVHEMTHALQDQHFDLDAIQQEIYADVDVGVGPDQAMDRVLEDLDLAEPDVGADLAESEAAAAATGFQALVEGDAVRIESAYVDQLSATDLETYLRSFQEDIDQADADLAGVPAALRAFQATPYVLGQPLVALVGADGGNAAVDDMFDDHPRTEEHLLDPLSYVDRERPGPLQQPELPPGIEPNEVLDQGTMGAVELFVVLAERIDPLVALDAADGWGNATFVSWRQATRTCLRVLADGDTAADDAQLRGALTAWVTAAPTEARAELETMGIGRTMVESCDPGTGGAAGNERALDVLTLPTMRSQMTSFAVDGGADIETAWASGDCFVHQLTFDQLVTISELTAAPPPDLQAVIDGASETCGA